MRRFLFPFFFLALLLAGPALADDDTLAALILATNEKSPRPLTGKLEPFGADLERIFGYNSFYVLGTDQENIYMGNEEWFVPSEEFFVKITILEQLKAHYRLQVDLFQRKKLLVSSEVELAMDAPVYIRGPQWGKGQLVMVVSVIN